MEGLSLQLSGQVYVAPEAGEPKGFGVVVAQGGQGLTAQGVGTGANAIRILGRDISGSHGDRPLVAVCYPLPTCQWRAEPYGWQAGASTKEPVTRQPLSRLPHGPPIKACHASSDTKKPRFWRCVRLGVVSGCQSRNLILRVKGEECQPHLLDIAHQLGQGALRGAGFA